MRQTLIAASAACLLIGLSACAGGPTVATEGAAEAATPVTAEVRRDGERWTLEYRLNVDSPVWFFHRSALLRVGRTPWRPAWWKVETPGVVLERQGHYDVLRSADGGPIPRTVRIVMRPQPGDLEADYDPALVFSDGTTALFTNQFDIGPLASVEAAAALPMDLNGVAGTGGPARVRYSDAAGPVLMKGRRHSVVEAEDADTYVVFGEAKIEVGQTVTTVIDPGLPSWLGEELAGFTPQMLDYYTRRVGDSGARPTLLVSWTGPTKGRSSMGGSVLPGMISMVFEGEGVLDRDVRALNRARWFIGHEAAHFWLGSNGMRYARAREAWITEGGADLMAVRALKAIQPDYDARAMLQEEVDDCVRLAKDKPVASAAERGDHRAYYACGAVWAMTFEAVWTRAHNGGDWFDVLADLRKQEGADGILTREEWLAALERAGGDQTLKTHIDAMLDEGVADPAAVVADLFRTTGVAFRVEEGRVILT